MGIFDGGGDSGPVINEPPQFPGGGEWGTPWGGPPTMGGPPKPPDPNNPLNAGSFQNMPLSPFNSLSQDAQNQQQQQMWINYLKQRFPGYQIPGNPSFGQPANFQISNAAGNANDPTNYFNYWNDPNATNTENRAFSLPNYNQNRQMLTQGAQNWQGMSLDQLSPYRQQNADYINMLHQSALGQGPSAAQEQLKSGLEQNLAQQMAASQSGAYGQNPAMAQRQLMSQAGGLNQQTASAAAQLRAQEQLSAQQQLGGAISNMRSQDLQSQAMQNSMVQYYLGQGFDLDTAQAASRQALESMLSGNYQQAQLQMNALQGAAGMAAAQRSQSQQNAAIGAGATIVGAVAGGLLGSDRRLKTDIKESRAKLDKFLNALKDYEYKYKDPKFGEGRHYSVMAQDLEKTPVGRSMVLDTPHGKMVDYGRGLAVLLASQAHLNAKVNALEKGT